VGGRLQGRRQSVAHRELPCSWIEAIG
jgi:hypothetical protein